MLQAALKTVGPCLSTELAAYLVKTHSLSDVAARKRVSRSAPGVKRLAHLPFARDARFVYLQSEYASKRYWRNLHAAILAAKGPYARALGAVLARTAIPLEQFRGACGAPIAQRKQVSADMLLQRLVAADILEIVELPGIGKAVTTKQTADRYRPDLGQLASQTRARLIAEKTLLDSIRVWAKNLALASYNKVVTREALEQQLPKVGPFAWDMTGPSYLTATATWKDGVIRPGWFVCDVILHHRVTLQTVEPFLHKVRSIQALPKIGRTIFVFVAERYDELSFAALRTAGVVPATLKSLFGKDAAEAFIELVTLLGEAGDGYLDAEALERTIEALSKIDGAMGNMRGALFEFVVAELVRKHSPAQLQLNQTCEGSDGKAEVDVWEVKDGVVARFIECKGMEPGSPVDDQEVERWLNTRIPRVRHHLEHQMRWKGPRPKFELWTSGVLSAQSLALISDTKRANARKFDLDVIGPEEIRSRARSVGDKPLLTVLENHFLRRPKRVRRPSKRSLEPAHTS